MLFNKKNFYFGAKKYYQFYLCLIAHLHVCVFKLLLVIDIKIVSVFLPSVFNTYYISFYFQTFISQNLATFQTLPATFNMPDPNKFLEKVKTLRPKACILDTKFVRQTQSEITPGL